MTAFPQGIYALPQTPGLTVIGLSIAWVAAAAHSRELWHFAWAIFVERICLDGSTRPPQEG